MADNSDNASEDAREEEDEEEYDEAGEGSRLLGFMFGNVDNSGDLDVDYLDKDAKEHLAALADKLGSSLTDIDLSVKSAHTSADGAEQDYDEKAEDAVDYEDFDEQYEGPEVLAASEEDHLLPKRDYYFSTEISVATLERSSPLFDDENYDEDEEVEKEVEKEPELIESSVQAHGISALGDHSDGRDIESEPPGDNVNRDPFEAGNMMHDVTGVLEDQGQLEEPFDIKSSVPLPVLYVEDGKEILRFSEIFGIHELRKRVEKTSCRSIPKDQQKHSDSSDIVEEDEEVFLRSSSRGFSAMIETLRAQFNTTKLIEEDLESAKLHRVPSLLPLENGEKTDSYLCGAPMKEDTAFDLYPGRDSSIIYPLDQEDWEDRIIWNTSQVVSENFSASIEVSGPESEGLDNGESAPEFQTHTQQEPQTESDEEHHNAFVHSYPVILESFGSRESSISMKIPFSERRYHPQVLRLESRMELNNLNHLDTQTENILDELPQSDVLKRLSKLTLQNRDIMDGSWEDNIMWDLHKPAVKPKLIFDLQDERMLFEVLENKEGRRLRHHAGAMIISRPSKYTSGDSVELAGHGQSGSRFNIANDKFYSNRRTSKQNKSISKKRTAHGIKVLHSTPALKLQTMKLKLSNKDIANFHRPKALWYPHDNEVALKEQEKLPTQGPMKIILKSLGGKGSKLHVDSEETLSSVKAKASKKLDFKPSEAVRIYYSGKELDDHKSLAEQNVRPNSLLHLVRTKIYTLPRAQKLPGENKSLRPPGAFKKKADLSAKDGHVFLMEYCEERPLLLGNAGMGARLCTYYQKSSPEDQTGTQLRNENSSLGSVVILDATDKSPFLGDIKPGCCQSSLETNMFRAPIFSHKVPSTDYLLVRSAKGKLSIRRLDRVNVVGQQEPHMEVMSPGTKGLQTYMINRLLVHMFRSFFDCEKRGLLPCIRADELSAPFPSLSEAILRKRIKHCADLQKKSNGQLSWIMRRKFRLPLEEELRRMVTPEHVCAYESMQAGLYRLKHLGITRLTQPTGISSAMNQLPDEAIALAAASHIERELQITPWNLSSNFVTCTNQGRETIERLEITGVGDPSGRGLGFSYVRSVLKAPVSSGTVKKKAAIARGAPAVTGTDADLRRLSMDNAREVLLTFNVPEEQIAKLTRWHRIALIRKLSSEQAESGVKVDSTTINKYARGQRMSFLQLQQQTREKCQEIWDRQFESLSAADGDETESESEANSDLDSFAGDLENLLDAEEFEEGEEGNNESRNNKADGVRGLKMRRRPSQALAEEEIEDEAAEAAELCRMLMDDEEIDRKKKKKMKHLVEEPVPAPGSQAGFSLKDGEQVRKIAKVAKQNLAAPKLDGSYGAKDFNMEQVETKKNMVGKVKATKKFDITNMGSFNKKVKIIGDGAKLIKEKKSARDSFICGACGQLGHMRTNKNCPKYREDPETRVENTDLEKAPGISDSMDSLVDRPQKSLTKKLVPKSAMKIALVESVEGEPSNKAKTLKFKCGSAENGEGENVGEKPAVKVSKIKISNKSKPDDIHAEPHKATIVIRPPVDTDRDLSDIHKHSLVIRPPTETDSYFESHKQSIVIRPPAEIEREQPLKRIVFKRPKDQVIDLDQISQDASPSVEYQKTKRMAELSGIENKPRKQESKLLLEESAKMKARDDKRFWEEEEKRRNANRLREERERRIEERRRLEEEDRIAEIMRYEETIRREREEEERQKAKKKKKKKLDMREDSFEDYSVRRNDRRFVERGRSAKRKSVVESGRYSADYAPPPSKRRRGGEVGLSNIFEKIVETLRKTEVSFLFRKPVTRKEAPDYLDIIETPMDLSKIKEKVRQLEYKNSEDFRHDVWLIAKNAHMYNDGRNPSIPPLADQLLELCDYLIEENRAALEEAEAGI